jgi:hypothetical protein
MHAMMLIENQVLLGCKSVHNMNSSRALAGSYMQITFYSSFAAAAH